MPVHRALAPICVALLASAQPLAASADPMPPDTTYRQLPVMPPSRARAIDEAQKPAVRARQRELLEGRYDLADRPLTGVMMSGGTKTVQEGVRVRLPDGQDWDSLAAMTPAEIRDGELLPKGFLPLPHVKQATGGQVFPQSQIDRIAAQEQRDHRLCCPRLRAPSTWAAWMVSHRPARPTRNFWRSGASAICPMAHSAVRCAMHQAR